jgi:hypothetical protein
MDKNIAALLREDTKTVHVSFESGLADFDDLDDIVVTSKPAGAKAVRPTPGHLRLYTYVTHLDVKRGDTVVVEAAGEIKLANVIRVDEQAEIEPNSSVAYKWVIDKVDMVAYDENQQRNAEIERTVGEAYRQNLRRTFAQAVLGTLEDGKRDDLAKLLKGE